MTNQTNSGPVESGWALPGFYLRGWDIFFSLPHETGRSSCALLQRIAIDTPRI